MSTPLIPNEMWLAIGTSLDRNDHRSLVLVCRNFHHIFTSALFSSFTINFSEIRVATSRNDKEDAVQTSKFAAAGPSAALRFEQLETNTILRSSVRSMSLKNLRDWSLNTEGLPGNDTRAAVMMRVLAGLPLLREVTFIDCTVHIQSVLYLASHSTQQVDLCMQDSMLFGEPNAMGVKLKLRSLAFYSPWGIRGSSRWPRSCMGLSAILSGTSLTALNIHLLPFSTMLYDSFIQLGRPCLLHLQSLSITYFKRDQLGILRALPNLRELMFHDYSGRRGAEWGPSEFPPGEGGEGAVGRLEIIRGNNVILPAMTAGRSIISIFVADALLGIGEDFMDWREQFGSKVMVRKVDWRECAKPHVLLDYLVAKNPGVRQLTIEPLYAVKEEVFVPLLAKLSKLVELQTLEFKTGYQKSIKWEESEIESLRRKCPSLVSVSLSELITWTRHPDDEKFTPSGRGIDEGNAGPPVSQNEV